MYVRFSPSPPGCPWNFILKIFFDYYERLIFMYKSPNCEDIKIEIKFVCKIAKLKIAMIKGVWMILEIKQTK